MLQEREVNAKFVIIRSDELCLIMVDNGYIYLPNNVRGCVMSGRAILPAGSSVLSLPGGFEQDINSLYSEMYLEFSAKSQFTFWAQSPRGYDSRSPGLYEVVHEFHGRSQGVIAGHRRESLCV